MKETRTKNHRFKVLFISPYDYESFAVRTLQTFMKSKGYPTETIFFKNLAFNRMEPPSEKEKTLLFDCISKIRPNIICVSVRSPFFDIMAELTASIRKKFKNSLVIWGGTHATICPEECIGHADFVNVGEGELSILEFVQRIERNDSVDDIKNFWIKKPDRIIKNDLRPLLQNLDMIPLFDYSPDNKHYIDNNKLIEGDPMLIRENRGYYIMAGRGCPFACTYCSNSYLHKLFEGKGSYVRACSVRNVIDRLKHAKKTFKDMKEVFFCDEVFGLNKEWLGDFIREYPKEVGIGFMCEFHPSVVNEYFIRQLKNIGLTNVVMGIQTGSERVRYEVFKRFVSDKEILTATEILKRHGVMPHYDVIVDNPYETVGDMKKGIDFLLKIPRPYIFNIYSLVNFPKTELTERLIRDGLISSQKSDKALTQWRMSLKFKRSMYWQCYNSLILLLSINFVPKKLIKMLSESDFLWEHPSYLVTFASVLNGIKIIVNVMKNIMKKVRR